MVLIISLLLLLLQIVFEPSEIWNFLPMFLLEEFNPKVKIANCYFLIISGLQCIRVISNTGGYPTVLIPLSIVLLISGIFKAAEDIARHKADKQVPPIVCPENGRKI